METTVQVENVHRLIYLVRGQKVMLDQDLAELYQVPTKALMQSVKRNLDRFPGDFMFRLTAEEARRMRSQFVTASKRNIRFAPHAFTEHGVAMLSSVLKSRKAVQVNIVIVRAFIEFRRMIAADRELAKKVSAHEKKITGLTNEIHKIYDLIFPLLDGPMGKIDRIGFRSESLGAGTGRRV